MNLEQPQQPHEQHFRSLREVYEHKKELTRPQLVTELWHLRQLGFQTVELLQAANKLDAASAAEFKELITLEALVDVPNAAELVPPSDRKKLEEVIAILSALNEKNLPH